MVATTQDKAVVSTFEQRAQVKVEQWLILVFVSRCRFESKTSDGYITVTISAQVVHASAFWRNRKTEKGVSIARGCIYMSREVCSKA